MLFKKKRHEKDSSQRKKTLDNPYLEARAEWDDRYWRLSESKRNWQLAFGAVTVIALILAVTNTRLATQSHILPIAVETCQGTTTGILPVQVNGSALDMIVRFSLSQFIVNARTIVSDTDAQKALLDKVYAYSADNTLPFLADYYDKNDPFTLAATQTAEVNILESMPISANTWQVTFDVTDKGQGGNGEQSRWLATLTYRQGEVNPKYIAVNPFGLYVTNVTWTQISTH